MQVCPELRNALPTPTFTALVRSASERITLADLPPSSSATLAMRSAAACEMARPVAVEPVNDTMSTPGWPAMAAPTIGPVPVTRLSTPAGTPASSAASNSRYATSGVSSLGLRTTVQPAASAAATLATTWCSG